MTCLESKVSSLSGCQYSIFFQHGEKQRHLTLQHFYLKVGVPSYALKATCGIVLFHVPLKLLLMICVFILFEECFTALFACRFGSIGGSVAKQLEPWHWLFKGWIKCYPPDKSLSSGQCISFPNTYPLNSDLIFGGQRYPMFWT